MNKLKKANYKDSYIAFLDILGFKNRVKRDGFEKIRGIYNIIKQITGNNIAKSYSNAQIALTVADDPDNPDPKCTHYNTALKKTKIRIMLDSIVISVPALYPESLAVIVDICNTIQYMLYEYQLDFTDPVLLRGAITRGISIFMRM